MISDLTKIANSWLDPDYPLRQQAIARAAQEFCLSQASFELALDWIFNQWTEAKITSSIDLNPYQSCRYAVQILAGNTPAMIAQGFFQGAILDLPQCIKIPSQQTRFASLLLQSFLEHSTRLASLFEVITRHDHLPQFYSRLRQADLVLAYGRDETMVTLKEHISPDAIFVTHGHTESAAIIFKEAANTSCFEKLAYDMLSYDQRGCLSPHVCFIEQGGELHPQEFARLFAQEFLPSFAQTLPRGGLFSGEAEEIFHQRIACGFRGKVHAGDDWTVAYADKLLWPVKTLPRFLHIQPFSQSEELITLLNPMEKRLMCLGYAGTQTQLEALRQTLSTDFYPLGEMQKQLLVF